MFDPYGEHKAVWEANARFPYSSNLDQIITDVI